MAILGPKYQSQKYKLNIKYYHTYQHDDNGR